MRKIKFVVLHHNGVDGRTIEDIRRTHKAFGWRDIGYHKVVHEDATVHQGRPDAQPGAHTAGLNAHTLAICVIGDLNKHPMTPEQATAVVNQCVAWCLEHGVSARDVIGHRETRGLVPPALRTKKACPGKHTSMEYIRMRVDARLAFAQAQTAAQREQAMMACKECRLLPFSATALVAAPAAGYKIMSEHAAFVKPCKAHA